jgi:amidase
MKKWQSTRDPETGREVDILLTPAMPHVALPHRHCRWVGYTKFCNLLDYTALVVPGGTVDRDADVTKDNSKVAEYEPRNDQDRWNWGLYDPDVMHGLPIGIQIVGQQLQEEKVLGAAKVVEAVLKA